MTSRPQAIRLICDRCGRAILSTVDLTPDPSPTSRLRAQAIAIGCHILPGTDLCFDCSCHEVDLQNLTACRWCRGTDGAHLEVCIFHPVAVAARVERTRLSGSAGGRARWAAQRSRQHRATRGRLFGTSAGLPTAF